MTRRATSLQARLLALVLGAVAAVWIATAAITWRDVADDLEELLDGHLAQAAALLVLQQARDAGGHDDEVEQEAPSPHRYAPKVAFQVFHEGQLLVRSANAPAAPMVAPSGKHARQGFSDVRLGGTLWRVYAARGAERDVQVYVGEQAASRRDILLAVLRGTLMPMALALPLLALLVWWAIRRGVAPLHRLGRTLAERPPQGLHPVVLDDAPAEVVPVVDALNALFGRIAALLDSERRFTADAAHELRTPIAAIRAQAQVALAEADADERRHALEATLAGCDRATRLVDQLLTLSRLEAAPAPGTNRVDLAALLRQVAADVAPKAIVKGQTLDVQADAPCPVAGDETLLAVLLRNLLDNAVRYAPSGATVRATARQDGTQVRLAVEDSGRGLSDADRARLGQRFFRVAGSGESGSGLGWSIVRRIAAVHGLQLEVQRSADLGGLAVRLSAPAA